MDEALSKYLQNEICVIKSLDLARRKVNKHSRITNSLQKLITSVNKEQVENENKVLIHEKVKINIIQVQNEW